MCDCVANCVRGCVRLLQVLANVAQRSSRIRPQVCRGLLCHSVVLGCCFKTFLSHCAATTQNAFASYQMHLHVVCKTRILFLSASCSWRPGGLILSPSRGERAYCMEKKNTNSQQFLRVFNCCSVVPVCVNLSKRLFTRETCCGNNTMSTICTQSLHVMVIHFLFTSREVTTASKNY